MDIGSVMLSLEHSQMKYSIESSNAVTIVSRNI